MSKQKTIAQILKKAKKGDILKAGKLKWFVTTTNFGGVTVATPINKHTKCELWSQGLESIAIIPKLKIVKK